MTRSFMLTAVIVAVVGLGRPEVTAAQQVAVPSGQPARVVQPTRSWHRPKGQGLLLQPATHIGSHFTSNSTCGFFFVPGSHTQIGTSPHVPPQCMQAGFSSFFAASFLSADFAFSPAFSPALSLSAAPQAKSATVSSRAVMVRLGMAWFSGTLVSFKSRSRTAYRRHR